MNGDKVNIIPEDYNGDGKTDFIRQEKGDWANDDTNTANVFLAIGDGTFTKQDLTNFIDMKGDLTNIIPGDYNGDGKTDFIRQEKGDWANDDIMTAEIYLSIGDGTFKKLLLTDYKVMKGDLVNIIPEDYNGDGKTDFIRQEKGVLDGKRDSADIYLSNGDGTFTRHYLNDSFVMWKEYVNIIPGDYNGDGKTDFIRQEKGAYASDDVMTAEIYLWRKDQRLITKMEVNGKTINSL